MKLLPSFALGALLLASGAAQAQTKIKTKTKSATGTQVKAKSEATTTTSVSSSSRVESLSGINIFPKPKSNSVMLSFTEQFTQPGTLVMTDSQNKVVYQTNLDPATNTGAPADLGHIPAGTYLIEAKTGNKVYWKKVRVRY